MIARLGLAPNYHFGAAFFQHFFRIRLSFYLFLVIKRQGNYFKGPIRISRTRQFSETINEVILKLVVNVFAFGRYRNNNTKFVPFCLRVFDRLVVTLERLIHCINLLVEAGNTVVVIEHDMAFVRELGARTIVLHHGEVIASGPVEVIEHNEMVRDVYLGRR